jgi:hypothetical protein
MRAGGALARVNPALVLFLLSPVLGEVVSGHLSPLGFLNPIRFAITVVPYGCGALLVREVLARRGKGWLSLLLLGLAFGLYFEGIVTRVIFNPNWEGLDSPGTYGHAWGVNWTQATALVLFHAVISIAGPVLIVEMLHPERRHAPWVGRRTLMACGALLLAWPLVLGALAPYMPPVLGALALLGLATALVIGALLAPADRGPGPASRPAPPVLLGIIGGAGMSFLMAGAWIIPTFKSRPPMPVMFLAMLLVLIVECAALTLLLRRPENRTPRHQLAMIIGFLSFFLVVGGLQDLEGFRGHSLVSAATAWLLWRLWRRAGRARPPGSPSPRPAPRPSGTPPAPPG